MKTANDIRKPGQFRIKLMSVGDIGSGKTYLAGTFPRTFFLNCEPGGMDTINVHPSLSNNLVGWEEFIPESAQDSKTRL